MQATEAQLLATVTAAYAAHAATAQACLTSSKNAYDSAVDSATTQWNAAQAKAQADYDACVAGCNKG